MKSRLDTKASFKGKLDTYRFCDNVSVPQELVCMELFALFYPTRTVVTWIGVLVVYEQPLRSCMCMFQKLFLTSLLNADSGLSPLHLCGLFGKFSKKLTYIS